MMINRCLVAFTLLAAFVNPVPSRAEFHPVKWRNDPIADDMMGSGLELRDRLDLPARAACEEPMEQKVARQWRDLAQRVRRLASLSSGPEQERFLSLARDYEARARRWEQRQKGDLES